MTATQPTNRDHPRAPAHLITSETTVADAGFELLAERQPAAVVHRDGRPVGVVTVEDLAGHDGRCPLPDALVGDVMSRACVRIDPAWLSVRRRRPEGASTVARRERSFLVFAPNRPEPTRTGG